MSHTLRHCVWASDWQSTATSEHSSFLCVPSSRNSSMTSYFRLCDCADSERKHEIYGRFKKDSNKPDEQIESDAFSLLHLSRKALMRVKYCLLFWEGHIQSRSLRAAYQAHPPFLSFWYYNEELYNFSSYTFLHPLSSSLLDMNTPLSTLYSSIFCVCVFYFLTPIQNNNALFRSPWNTLRPNILL